MGKRDIEWIIFIQRLKKTGMDLTEIQRYFELQHTISERLEMLNERKLKLLVQQQQLEDDLRFLDGTRVV